MSDLPDEPKLIIDDIKIIYKPKPKRIYQNNCKLFPIADKPVGHSHKNKKSNKQKFQKQHENWNLKLKKDGIAKSQNFNLISFEEIENDFKELKAKSEIFEVENELLKLFCNSTNDTSFDEEEKNKKGVRIKRPKNIFYENLE
jgi:hypothetical protein